MTKAVILAGGFGTRLSEETDLRPKPMVEIGQKPILWHIMKIFAAQGVRDFVLLLGYKGDLIKNYFLNYSLLNSDFTVGTKTGRVTVHNEATEDWNVTLISSGLDGGTGGRLLSAEDVLTEDDYFFFTYGDGVADVGLPALESKHAKSGAQVTVTAVQPQGRFGSLQINGDDAVQDFMEKPRGDGGWTNAGYFVVSTNVFSLIPSAEASWEEDVLPQIARNRGLVAHRHHGFWQPMDTLRDKRNLNSLWETGSAPWKMWD